ncbi:hypothetical protein HK101_004327 [Irineochytrium annulatum]|nr:hypothetical protein HK101_004327 [Irineochytrium annulatum]
MFDVTRFGHKPTAVVVTAVMTTAASRIVSGLVDNNDVAGHHNTTAVDTNPSLADSAIKCGGPASGADDNGRPVMPPDSSPPRPTIVALECLELLSHTQNLGPCMYERQAPLHQVNSVEERKTPTLLSTMLDAVAAENWNNTYDNPDEEVDKPAEVVNEPAEVFDEPAEVFDNLEVFMAIERSQREAAGVPHPLPIPGFVRHAAADLMDLLLTTPPTDLHRSFFYNLLIRFATTQLLPYVELMSTLGLIESLASKLSALHSLLQPLPVDCDPRAHALILEAAELLTRYANAIRADGRQVYASALAFAPLDSLLYKTYSHLLLRKGMPWSPVVQLRIGASAPLGEVGTSVGLTSTDFSRNAREAITQTRAAELRNDGLFLPSPDGMLVFIERDEGWCEVRGVATGALFASIKVNPGSRFAWVGGVEVVVGVFPLGVPRWEVCGWRDGAWRRTTQKIVQLDTPRIVDWYGACEEGRMENLSRLLIFPATIMAMSQEVDPEKRCVWSTYSRDGSHVAFALNTTEIIVYRLEPRPGETGRGL